MKKNDYVMEAKSQKPCKRIEAGTCRECSACGEHCEYYIPEDKKEYSFGYGYGIWGGRIIDLLPHGTRYYHGAKD